MQALVAQAQQLGKRYGDAWRSCADALLVGSLETSSTDDGSSLTADLVLVEVRQLLAAGDHTAAIEKLVAFRDHEGRRAR